MKFQTKSVKLFFFDDFHFFVCDCREKQLSLHPKMFKLDRHIEILLLNHDCVIVPGFGGFVTHHVAARFDDSDNTMLPPMVTVGFNPQLTLNDSLLAQSYVDAYDVSYPEALREIESEVQELRLMLAEHGYFEIHSVGKLYIGKQGLYEFEPFEAGLLVPRLYALTGVDTNDREAFITHKETVKEVAVIQPDVTNDTEQERTITISVSTLRRVAVACAVALVLLSLPFLRHDDRTQQLLSSIDTSIFGFFTPREAETPKVVMAEKPVYHVYVTKKQATKPAEELPTLAQPEKAAESELSLEAQPVEAQPVDAKPNKKFTVVLAAQVTQKNAEAYVADLKSRGYKEARTIGEGKSRKVVYGSFASEDDAHKMKRTMASSKEFESAWILKI